MSAGELAALLFLTALCLWLTIFLFTLVDHFIYRETYGHFLLGLQSIERHAGSADARAKAVDAHMRAARAHYLARYLSNAASDAQAAKLASQAYIEKIGVEALLARASAPSAPLRSKRLVALYALSRTGKPETLPLLEQALASKQPLLAYAALDMLDIHGSRGAAEVLLRALERDVLPASRISTHLAHFRLDLTDLYISWLESDHPKSRYWVAYLLGESRYTPRTGDILARLLSDPAADLRKIALSALSALDAPGLQSHAERMLDDPVFYVRTLAARILARFPNAEAVHALATRLSDANDSVQLAAKRSLVELGVVTLDHLATDGPLSDASTGATVLEITNSIRNALSDAGDAVVAVAHESESTHV